MGNRNHSERLATANHNSNPQEGFCIFCQNYKGISLLCVASKDFGRAVLNRIQKVLEKHLDDNQCGFRQSRGCVDQIFSVKILMQRAKEFNKPIHLCFVDLQKAYDTVNRGALWEILSRSFNIPEKLIRIIKTLHSGTTGLACSFAGCTKICANKAGLSNHYRRIHQTQQTIRCEYCGLSFKHQGIHNHRKKCSTSNLLHLPHGG